MGKLTDLLKRSTRTEQEQMGFGAAGRKPQRTMLLVAIVGDHWSRAAAEAIDAGADVLLLYGRPGDSDIQEAVVAAKDKPCGVLASDATAEQLARLKQGGVDFAVIGPSAPASATVGEAISLAFHLRDDLTDIQLRAIDGLSFDVVYVDRDAAPPTVMRLIELQRIAGLTRKPLLVQVPPESAQADLQALREAGVALAAVDMKDRNTVDALRKLHEVIDNLPRRKPRHHDRAGISLPRASAAEHDHDDDDDDDDDE